jgi:hypothetical protein
MRKIGPIAGDKQRTTIRRNERKKTLG